MKYDDCAFRETLKRRYITNEVIKVILKNYLFEKCVEIRLIR